ncbi:NAD(P)H-dependent glycerol-3-phosphate dehydrogenase [Kamptonema cortianum]|nr:NAD(P)H-dependent glycerol-3-phosphate dehydrogenase [Geitlerinema splendidum]MDK3161197.1 NAD(P)H-dependent glycerol-3-phosphate dehydrogenase [Kamptonema cortianum]
MRVVIIGGGSWGTALSLVLARQGHEAIILTHTKDAAAGLQKHRENLQYLPGFAFPDSLTVAGPDSQLPEADFAVVAVPTSVVPENLIHLAQFPVICVASKGLDPETGRVLSEVVQDSYPNKILAALSGPNLAVELARGIPTAAVCASNNEEAALLVRSAFSCSSYRVYISDDMKGVELAGALKNVIAIGAGMSDGMGFGDNTKGAFLARGLSEMTKLGVALGARMETFLGLAGVGDLFATAASTLSRNYRVGYAIGQGQSLQQAVDSLGQVAEGVPTSDVVLMLASKVGVEVPLMETLHSVMHGKMGVKEGLSRLMERQTLRETGVPN